MMKEQPPFKIPLSIKNGSNYRWVERKIAGYSDGDPVRHPPAGSGYRSANIDFYLCYLGQRWAETDGLSEYGVHYYLNELPSGYAMFEINQPDGPQVYKRLFGHPSGRFYDSAPKFGPHFLWLMSEMEGDCPCLLCGQKPFKPRPRNPKPKVNAPKIQRAQSEHTTDEEQSVSDMSGSPHDMVLSRRNRRRTQQSRHQRALDEEGNDDIYKNCLSSLEIARGSKKITEIDLKEEDCIDWRAERSLLPQFFAQLSQQHSFVPRVGELVLWCLAWPAEQHLMLDPATMEYKLYSFQTRRFYGFPQWRGGIIAAAPSTAVKMDLVDFADILESPHSASNLNNSGFRVETMSDPNDEVDKSMSKQYMHIALRYMRPLSHWKLLLRGTSVSQLHESIKYALTAMTTISVLEKWMFLGDWPRASILCKGIYLGSELITVGDSVRIWNGKNHDASRASKCTDILVVTSIRYNLEEIQSRHVSADTSTLSDISNITIVGNGYTTDVAKLSSTAAYSSNRASVSSVKIKELSGVVGANEYGPWYPMHAPGQKLEVSHDMIIGRLYEADAVRLWFGQRQYITNDDIAKPSLDFDIDGVIAGRVYASASDERLPEPEKVGDINWFLADNRAEALAISSLNGVEVGVHHDIRDQETLKHWRDAIRIVDGRSGDVSSARASEMVSWTDVPFTDLQDGDSDVTENFENPSSANANVRKRGRPVGSKVIDGKLVTAGQLARINHRADQREEMILSSQFANTSLVSDVDSEVTTSREASNKVGKRRRGRPPGSRVVDGKLILAGQNHPRDVGLDQREKFYRSHRMVDAALMSDSEYSRSTEARSKTEMRRRGRPPGSRVVNGKLILAGQNHLPDAGSDQREKLNRSSLLSDAKLISDSEYSRSTEAGSTTETRRRGRPPGSKLVNGKLVRAEDLSKIQGEAYSTMQTINTVVSHQGQDLDSQHIGLPNKSAGTGQDGAIQM